MIISIPASVRETINAKIREISEEMGAVEIEEEEHVLCEDERSVIVYITLQSGEEFHVGFELPLPGESQMKH